MLTLITKPRILLVPFFEEPTHPNYREAVWDETSEVWRVPPEVNTIHGVVRSDTITWRGHDEEGFYQEYAAAEQRKGRVNILEGVRDGEVVKQAANVRIEGLQAAVAPTLGGFA